jgi:hypothetical protein
LVGKLEGKRPLGKTRRRWESNRKNLREIGWEVGDCMHQIQGRATVKKVKTFRFHKRRGI